MVTFCVNDLMNGEKCCLDGKESQILVWWFCTVGHCVHPTLAFLQVLATDGPCGLAFKCSVLGLFFCFPPSRVLQFLNERGKTKKVNILALQLPPVWGCRGDGSTQGSPIMSPFSSSPSSSSLFATSSSLSLPASPLLLSDFGAACDSTPGWFGHSSVTSLNFPDKCGAPNFKSCFPTLWVAENWKKCKRSILCGRPVHSSSSACVGAVQPANCKQLVVFTLKWFCLNFRLIWERNCRMDEGGRPSNRVSFERQMSQGGTEHDGDEGSTEARRRWNTENFWICKGDVPADMRSDSGEIIWVLWGHADSRKQHLEHLDLQDRNCNYD